MVLSRRFFATRGVLLVMKTLEDERYVVIKAYKCTVSEIWRDFICISIYCMYVVSLHTESTDSVTRESMTSLTCWYPHGWKLECLAARVSHTRASAHVISIYSLHHQQASSQQGWLPTRGAIKLIKGLQRTDTASVKIGKGSARNIDRLL